MIRIPSAFSVEFTPAQDYFKGEPSGQAQKTAGGPVRVQNLTVDVGARTSLGNKSFTKIQETPAETPSEKKNRFGERSRGNDKLLTANRCHKSLHLQILD